MEIIPVMDILNGKVVSGKSGNRENYKPIKSVICSSSEPSDVVNTYKKLGANKIYIADLDAIMKNGNNYDVIKKLDIYKMVDFGVSMIEDYNTIKKLNLCDKIIVGTETLKDIDILKKNNIILSLDYKNDKLLNYDLDDILKEINQNIPIIILNISSVGTYSGINIDLIKEVIGKCNNPIYVGGGIRDRQDLDNLYNLNVNGVLIGSAIHSGLLNLSEIINIYK